MTFSSRMPPLSHVFLQIAQLLHLNGAAHDWRPHNMRTLVLALVLAIGVALSAPRAQGQQPIFPPGQIAQQIPPPPGDLPQTVNNRLLVPSHDPAAVWREVVDVIDDFFPV